MAKNEKTIYNQLVRNGMKVMLDFFVEFYFCYPLMGESCGRTQRATKHVQSTNSFANGFFRDL